MSANLDIAAKLDEARALIDKGWVQGLGAVDENGRCTFYHKASAFCAFGAVMRVYTVDGETEYWTAYEVADFLDLVAQAKGYPTIVSFNDAPERTQAEVVEVFREAAELARAGAVA